MYCVTCSPAGKKIKIADNLKKCVAAPILKLTDDQKLETLLLLPLQYIHI